MVVPFTGLEWLRLHVLISFCALAPVFAHVGANVLDVAVPVWASKYIYAKFAILAVAISILVVCGRLKVDAGG